MPDSRFLYAHLFPLPAARRARYHEYRRYRASGLAASAALALMRAGQLPARPAPLSRHDAAISHLADCRIEYARASRTYSAVCLNYTADSGAWLGGLYARRGLSPRGAYANLWQFLRFNALPRPRQRDLESAHGAPYYQEIPG